MLPLFFSLVILRTHKGKILPTGDTDSLGRYGPAISTTSGSGCFAMAHTDRQTYKPWTWQLYDQPSPEGRVSEK